MKTVLVTGGAGYIGSHTCKTLASCGYHPVAYDNLTSGHEWAVKWGPLDQGDINDRGALEAAISKHQPVAVLHFAAHAYVSESVREPAKYYDNNVSASLVLFKVAREAGIKYVVFSSSCAIYGVPEKVPINEDTPQRPINPYGRTKLVVEQMLHDFDTAYGLKWMALRYFNAAGADPDGQIGESHDPETHIIPLAMDAASGRSDAITVFGSDYQTADGTCIRDYVHVCDLASAHVKALDALMAGEDSGTYNLGNGRGYSVKEVMDSVERVAGARVPFKLGERRRGDPAILVSDTKKAHEELGWKPEIADLDEIVATAWSWHQQNKGE